MTFNALLLKNTNKMKTVKTILACILMIGYLQTGNGQCGTYTTIAAGDYFSASTWQNGLLPPNPVPPGTVVHVGHDLTITGVLENNGTIDATGHTLTINSGGHYGGSGTLMGNIVNNGQVSTKTFAPTDIPPALPGVTTSDVTVITFTTAECGGEVCYLGGLSQDIGIVSRGICWNTTGSPNIYDDNKVQVGLGAGSFTVNLSGLTKGTKYYVRAYATSYIGVAYGEEKSFIAFKCGDQLDYAGQSYATKEVGGQCWMAENINVGNIVAQGITLDDGIIERFCYGDNQSNCNTYGGLYSWNEAMEYTNVQGAQGICPANWHIPSKSEWDNLVSFLGSSDGSKMAGNASLWINGTLDSDPAFGSSGLNGLPSGVRNYLTYMNINGATGFWTSSKIYGYIYYRTLHFQFNTSLSEATTDGTYSLRSVRCVKD